MNGDPTKKRPEVPTLTEATEIIETHTRKLYKLVHGLLVYLAGPDIFNEQGINRVLARAALAADTGFNVLTPVDNNAKVRAGGGAPSEQAMDVFWGDAEMATKCDVIMANVRLMPNSLEPDSGTCFEIGAAYRSGALVILYVEGGSDIGQIGERYKDTEYGYLHEGTLTSFGQTHNLMVINAMINSLYQKSGIKYPDMLVFPSYEQALAFLLQFNGLDRWRKSQPRWPEMMSDSEEARRRNNLMDLYRAQGGVVLDPPLAA
ncbi:nucleoside 2-deoxyribosyltransferase [Candidatus Saccharibacteria bacterium]|nr:nucleoside 2-deoxyribosyltransferase [Candidatus Saccharibacteria bacterium]